MHRVRRNQTDHCEPKADDTKSNSKPGEYYHARYDRG
jgi:hypothetical protein